MALFSRRKRSDWTPPPGVDSLVRPDELDESYEVVEPHLVVTYLVLSGGQFGEVDEREAVFALEGRIADAVAEIGGEHDGNEFGGGGASLYTYGPDADALLTAIQGALRGFDVRPGSYALKRYGSSGPPDVPEERVELA